MAQYRFFMREADGTALAWIPPTSWLYFGYTRRVNDVGRFEGIFSPSISPSLMTYFDVEPGAYLDAILEVWRSPNQHPPVYRLEQQFLVRYRRDELLNDGRDRVTVIGRTPEFLLESCHIHPEGAIPPDGDEPADYYALWPWALPGAATFTGPPHTLVGSDTYDKLQAMFSRCLVTNPVALTNVVLGAAGAGGIPAHYIGERYSNLLKALQDHSAASWWASFNGLAGTPADNGCDFQLTPAVAAPYIPWTFNVMVGGWGADRRASSASPVIFSPEKGNVQQPVKITDRLSEKTRIIVGGDGQDAARDILLVINAARIADSVSNKREEYIDSRQIDAFANPAPPNGIDKATEEGQKRLKEKGIRRELTFIVSQQPNTEYQRDFDLGTLVSGKFNGVMDDYQVRQVEVNYSNTSSEVIAIELGPLDGSAAKGQDIFEQMLTLIHDTQVQAAEAAAGT